ncbi:hypothetical protein EYF80_047190 [Liparis tanakae]|uniref:Uncharacterized protein n=1 Tax=Liparis tanakae TaxID=230148 RepID=A0A4Z2FPE2_9TELE|nr:hypothetical protein EYF80_047190 [Liparis tanakae]
MWRRLPLLVACWAVTGLGALEPDRDAPRGARDPEAQRGAEQQSPGRDAPAATAEPLDEELDNQENIISQLHRPFKRAAMMLMWPTSARNLTARAREKERAKERAKEKEKERKAQQKKKKANDLERSGPKIGAVTHGNKQKSSDGPLKNDQQRDGLELQPTRNKTGAQKPIRDKPEPKQPITDKSGMVIRGVTFYKAEAEGYEEEDKKGKGKSITPTYQDFPHQESRTSNQREHTARLRGTTKETEQTCTHPATNCSPDHHPTNHNYNQTSSHHHQTKKYTNHQLITDNFRTNDGQTGNHHPTNHNYNQTSSHHHHTND